MKRELIQNVKVQPYTSGAALDRTGFLSGVIGAVIGTAGALTLTITHSDDNSSYEAVTDKLVFPEKQTEGGTFTTEELGSGRRREYRHRPARSEELRENHRVRRCCYQHHAGRCAGRQARPARVRRAVPCRGFISLWVRPATRLPVPAPQRPRLRLPRRRSRNRK